MVNNTSKIYIKFRLHIKLQPHVQIEKLFSVTHAPVFGYGECVRSFRD